MAYLFSSESVSEGHPDKVSDQISDALVDQFLAYDDEAHCAIETFVTTGQVVIMGEVRSNSYIDLQTIARNTINRIGYTNSTAIRVVCSPLFTNKATTSTVELVAKKKKNKALATKE